MLSGGLPGCSAASGNVPTDVRGNPHLTRLFKPLPFPRRPKPKEKRTTIIIGIRCKDGLVIASDSQLSGGEITELECHKLRKFNARDGSIIVVGGAGIEPSFKQAMNLLQDRLTDGIENEGQLVNLVEGAYLDVWNGYIDRRKRQLGLDRVTVKTAEEIMKSMYDDVQFGLVVGARLQTQDRYFLCKIAAPSVAATLIEKHDAIGTGSSIAEYILDKYWPTYGGYSITGRDYWTVHDAQELALYVVNEVKHARREDCGGPTKIWSVTQQGVDTIPEQYQSVDRLEGILQSMESARIWRVMPRYLKDYLEADHSEEEDSE